MRPSLIVCFLLASVWSAPSHCSPSRVSSSAVGRVAFNTNLILNPGAEAGTGSSSSGGDIVPVPNWTPSGSFTAVQYGSGLFPGPTSPGPPNRGRNFFAGGPGSPVSTGSQALDVSSSSADIDAGRVNFNLSAYLGGFDNQGDEATLTATFRDVNSATLLTSRLGPVTPTDRNNITGLLLRSMTGRVPVGTRSVLLVLRMERTSGSSNDGYADNLSLVFTSTTSSTITVTNTADSGTGSLRAAITAANRTAGTTIRFNIPRSDPNFSPATGTWTIRPTSTFLPSLTADRTLIEGLSQGNNQGDTNPNGPEIEVNGSSLPDDTFVSGLVIDASNCVVRGLVINGFEDDAGIGIGAFNSPGKRNNLVEACYIGTNFNATAAVPNGNGVIIANGARNNTIGGVQSTFTRNIISGNTGFGIVIEDVGTMANLVAGNFIGTNRTGTAALPNGRIGVFIAEGAENNFIGSGGGTNAASRNVISSNIDYGVLIDGGGTDGNHVEGNIIGPNAAGTALLTGANQKPDISGVEIAGGAKNNIIGGTSASERNIISGNGENGVQIRDTQSTGNVVQGNYIGVDITGTRALGNANNGVLIGASNNSVGGTASGARNVISGNASIGVLLIGASAKGNVVQGNHIGTNAAGTGAIANRSHGVALLDGAQNNLIGGTTTGAGNVISGNVVNGVAIGGSSGSGPQGGANTKNNRVQGNFIGTNALGTSAIPNQSPGIAIATAANNNTIGGSAANAGNVISGNNSTGIAVFQAGTTNNLVQGNVIGANASGTASLPNRGDGVAVTNGASGNIIGAARTESVPATIAALGNRIAFNTRDGVRIGDGTGNTVRGNRIFQNGELGINLQPTGEADSTVTPNDTGDADNGPNNLQNFPTINIVNVSGSTVTISGGINTRPNASVIFDVYRSSARDNSGFGEGEVFLGSRVVRTDANGNLAGTIPLDFSGSLLNQFITLTATNVATGDTSEFSRAVIASNGTTPTPTPTPTPTLALSISPASISENAGVATGTVSRSTSGPALIVTLRSSDSSEVAIPASVTIAAGSRTATFAIRGVNDDAVDGSQSVLITATANGFRAASATITVTDDDQSTLTGELLAWGYNDFGQLGDGSTVDRLRPQAVPNLSGARVVAAGGAHSLAIVEGGRVVAWGYNGGGQLGDGTRSDRVRPVSVMGLSDVTSIAAGWYHSLALRSDGTVAAWGFNGRGQLGVGAVEFVTTPRPVPGLSGIVAIAAGTEHSLAVRRDGAVFAWGRNDAGQVGDGSTLNRFAPTRVRGLSGATAIAGGGAHSLAVAGGLVFAWGDNQSGQLGLGNTQNHAVPQRVANLSNIATVAAGFAHSLALSESGALSSWGDNQLGQLGDGSRRDSSRPLEVLSNVTRIAAGAGHNLAVSSDGTLLAWGFNGFGGLGNASRENVLSPTAVVGLSDVTQISAGYAHSLAIGSRSSTQSTSIAATRFSSAAISGDVVSLHFTGALDERVAGIAEHYEIVIDGRPVPVERVEYRAGGRVNLHPAVAIPAHSAVRVEWRGLLGRDGQAIDDGQSTLIAR